MILEYGVSLSKEQSSVMITIKMQFCGACIDARMLQKQALALCFLAPSVSLRALSYIRPVLTLVDSSY